MSASFTGNVSVPAGFFRVAGRDEGPKVATANHPMLLPDTPDDKIVWEPMTAFLEYYEDTTFNAAGYRWFCVVGSEREANTDHWTHWYRAAPYIDQKGKPQDTSKEVSANGFASKLDAQAAAVTALRNYRATEK